MIKLNLFLIACLFVCGLAGIAAAGNFHDKMFDLNVDDTKSYAVCESDLRAAFKDAAETGFGTNAFPAAKCVFTATTPGTYSGVSGYDKHTIILPVWPQIDS
ncbi:MAG: hypothetical protein LBU24_02710 [Methanocalculaceae archaeon]|jgi:hypothetical protein|nr:hypothetical protein [Methanocalculaceae archaeon]